jgi:protein TonB
MTVPNWWITPGDYPESASGTGLYGALAYRVAVDTFGEVTGCEVTQSSGVAAFDHRACAAVSTRARFYPAQDHQQQTVAGLW